MRRGDGVRARPIDGAAQIGFQGKHSGLKSLCTAHLWLRRDLLQAGTLHTACATNGDASAVYRHLFAAKKQWVLTTSQHEDTFRGDIAAQR